MQTILSPKFLFPAIFLLLFIGYFGFSLYVAEKFTQPFNNPPIQPGTSVSSDFTNVAFTTEDNVMLKGWLYKGTNEHAIIMVHGWTQNRLNLDYGGVDIAKELLKQGYTVLMFDLRAHGESLERQGFGSKEYKDVIAAVNLMKENGFSDSHIGILSDSLGAISTLQAAPYLTGVGAIVADSSASDMKKFLSYRMVVDKHIPSIFHPMIFAISKFIFHAPLESGMPISSVRKTPEREYLFLHGGDDQFITVSHSQDLLAAANKKSKLVIIPNASHVHTYKTNPKLYMDTITTFFAEKLGK